MSNVYIFIKIKNEVCCITTPTSYLEIPKECMPLLADDLNKMYTNDYDYSEINKNDIFD